MKKPLSLILFGIVLGAGLMQAFHAIRARQAEKKIDAWQGEDLFERRLKCRQLAEAYAHKRSENGSVSVVVLVDRVEFSAARNSCFAALSGGIYGRRSTVHRYEVVDLLSEESLFSASCVLTDPKSSNFCGNGRNIKIGQERDKVFEEALTARQKGEKKTE